ncbi:hypothetical protein [Streptomyces abikoensis]|uniref:Uncharacterized protein n=1 Tax=Streptomyces abikoensis TaxID=97398 RepID=A0ABW7TEN4_9ACTN
MREVRELERLLAEERKARGELEVQHTKVVQKAERLEGKVAELERLQTAARRGQVDEATQLGARIDRLARACAGYRAELATEREKPGTSALRLLERTRRSLEAQLDVLQKSNDYMSRELLDRSGTLAAKAPAGREPGVVSS